MVRKTDLNPIFVQKGVNRHHDILPNPMTRVHMQQLGDDLLSTYYNANWIRGYVSTYVRPLTHVPPLLPLHCATAGNGNDCVCLGSGATTPGRRRGH